jgi:hypothetical protein
LTTLGRPIQRTPNPANRTIGSEVLFLGERMRTQVLTCAPRMPINRKTPLDELLQAAALELRELDTREPILIELRPLQAWALLGNLQLALGHERNTGATARVGRQIARLLEREVATTPALKEIARRGWKGEGAGWFH